MTRDAPDDGGGGRTAADGTPVAVDVSADRRGRSALASFLAGPVVMIVHFMLVYLVVEAGCAGTGPGLRLFDPPVSEIATLAMTAAAAVACGASARWCFVRWRERERQEASDAAEAADPGGSLALAGLLLSVLSFVTVLLVGLPAMFLPAC